LNTFTRVKECVKAMVIIEEVKDNKFDHIISRFLVIDG